MSEDDGSTDIPDDGPGTEVEPYGGGNLPAEDDIVDGEIVGEVEPAADDTVDGEVLDDGSDSIDPDPPGQSTSDAGPASRGGGGGGGGGGGQKRWRKRRPKKEGDGGGKTEYNLFRGGDKHKTNKILSDNKGIDVSGRKTPSDRRAARSTAAADRRAGRRSR